MNAERRSAAFGGGRPVGVSGGGDDRGGITLVGAVLSVAVLTVVWLGLQVGSLVVERHRVQGTADLAALAAAAHAPWGTDTACARAERVVRDTGIVLLSCRMRQGHARVRTASSRNVGPPGFRRVTGRAHAGPVHDERCRHDHSSC
ncbi:Rv3654c family TadE-like protein [Actinopolyspora mortivallis]|uniref:Rv3654c family TadE-like protein n=1 Tax=Actinopolyspora mortivallis TaxID=33906 RepID=UPI00035D59E0|nr:Rv3654c family TadE-like protein [Actinopolyspora mortivallis]